MNIIDYIPNGSFLDRMDPRVKVLGLLLFSIIVFVLDNLIMILVMLGLVVCCWNAAKLPWSDLKKFIKVVISLMALITLMQCCFYKSENAINFFGILIEHKDYIFNIAFPADFKVRFLQGFGLHWQGLVFSLLLALRLLTLIILMPMVIKSTRLDLFSLGLIKLKLPYRIAYMATTAINMVPTFTEEIGVIMDAQKMRGMTVFESGKLWAKVKAWITLVVPLVIGAMRRAQMMGVAMDTRAFGANKKRTCLSELHLQKSDIIAGIIAVAVGAALLVGNYALAFARISV
ncbi:MAG: energy-coupling factor transporter transmembrane protein EcfT [Oscillospiraceae bacterium]|nr:energy-coupling factor transporter transmembrane protein EcfT [Oscillospiraceae bacterium]